MLFQRHLATFTHFIALTGRHPGQWGLFLGIGFASYHDEVELLGD